MHPELPVFKRCCFCLPLRYGLIVWGYIKLVVLGLMIVGLSLMLSSVVDANHRYPMNERLYIFRIVVTTVVLFIVIFDFVLSAVFIIGGHKKNLKLLSAYYYYSIGFWILTILLSLFIISSYFRNIPYRMSFYALTVNILETSSHFVTMVLQGYFLLLLRSEILKLRSNCEFRFVNNAAQSECKMGCGKDSPDDNKTCKGDCNKDPSDV